MAKSNLYPTLHALICSYIYDAVLPLLAHMRPGTGFKSETVSKSEVLFSYIGSGQGIGRSVRFGPETQLNSESLYKSKGDRNSNVSKSVIGNVGVGILNK